MKCFVQDVDSVIQILPMKIGYNVWRLQKLVARDLYNIHYSKVSLSTVNNEYKFLIIFVYYLEEIIYWFVSFYTVQIYHSE